MRMAIAGAAVLAVVGGVALAAPFFAPNSPDQQFRAYLYAPPMRPHIVDEDGKVHPPFVYSLQLVDRLDRRFDEDRSHRRPLVWFSGGHLVQVADPTGGPLLLFGADQLGRDVFARLVMGARPSLAVALLAAAVALMIGALWGAVAAVTGGFTDEVLMRTADFVLVLPALYVVLALRSVTPLVLSPLAIVGLMVGVFAVVRWPYVARGVRAIVSSELKTDYALAARAVGVTKWRLLTKHLMPASRGFLAIQGTLLVPGFILAEATLSFVGLGFPDQTASWGVMLQDASNIRAIAEFPWLLSPAAAIVLVVLGVNLLARATPGHEPLQWTLRQTTGRS